MDSATQFKLINELIIAIAQPLWPIVTLIIVLVFRRDIAALLRRMRRGKLFGQEMELDPAVTEFRKAVEEAQEEIPESSVAEEQYEKEVQQLDRDEREVLEAAKVNPELGIIKLSSILEREIRVLAGSLGQLGQQRRIPATQLFRLLVDKGYLPVHTTKSLQIFWDLRNQIVHGYAPRDAHNVLKVLDIGLVLLKTIKSIPHEVNIVYLSGVNLYSDPECTNMVEGAKGLILETISPGKAEVFKRIFPTTRPNVARGSHGSGTSRECGSRRGTSTRTRKKRKRHGIVPVSSQEGMLKTFRALHFTL
ncbi:MAG TPA: hypothetical protein VHT73_06475 [Thermodesulfobacteriota bacterium]|nr:hypothetical protein [Thermodesulfobacteriota bacterium]